MPRISDTALAALLALAGLSSCAAEQPAPETDASQQLPTIGSIERLDPAFDAIVPRNAVLELISEGVDGEQWTEGPVWVPALQSVLYSEIPSNSIYRWSEGETPSIWLQPSGYTGDVARGQRYRE